MANNIQPVTAELLPAGFSAGPPGPEPSVAITPKFILNVARRWWKLSLLVGVVLASVTSLAVYVTYEPVYEATAWLRIRPRYLVFKGTEDHHQFANTQQQLIKSPLVIGAALSKPEISGLPIFDDVEDRIAWTQKQIAAQPMGQSELFTISLKNENKDSIAKVVNAVRDSYLQILESEVSRENQTLLERLEVEKQKRHLEISDFRTRLVQLNKEAPIAAAAPSTRSTRETSESSAVTSSLRHELSETEVELVLKTADLDSKTKLFNKNEIAVHDEVVRQAVEEEKDVVTLAGQIDMENQRLAEKGKELAAGSEKLKTLEALANKRIADLQEKLANKRKELAPKKKEELIANATAERDDALLAAKAKIEELEIKKKALEEQIERHRKNATQEGQVNLDAQFLQEDLNNKYKVFQMIAERIEAIKTESQSMTSVRTVADAQVPFRPIDSGPVKKTVMAAAIALLAPFGCFFLWEWRSRRVADIDEFSRASNLRVFGEIAALPVRSKLLPKATQRYEESLSRFEESIDYLRTSILIAKQQRNLQSLVVCSATSREGKSTVAAHLAASLARAMVGRVLLVDADIRRPHLHRLLDQEMTEGLVDYLAGRRDFKEVVHSTWVDGLEFVPAGTLDTPVGALLSGDRIERFLSHAGKQYDFILLDVPPILPVSDGLVIARAAGAAIFCALRDVSTVANITRAVDKLKAAEVNVLGAVFNGVPAREYGGDRYYYYRIPNGSAGAAKSL